MRKTVQQFKDHVKNQGWAAEIQYDFLTYFKQRPTHNQLMRQMIHRGLSQKEQVLDSALNSYQKQWDWIMQSTWTGLQHRLSTEHANVIIYDYTGGLEVENIQNGRPLPTLNITDLIGDLNPVFEEYLEGDENDKQDVMEELDSVKAQHGDAHQDYYHQPLNFYIQYINHRYDRDYDLTMRTE